MGAGPAPASPCATGNGSGGSSGTSGGGAAPTSQSRPLPTATAVPAARAPSFRNWRRLRNTDSGVISWLGGWEAAVLMAGTHSVAYGRVKQGEAANRPAKLTRCGVDLIP